MANHDIRSTVRRPLALAGLLAILLATALTLAPAGADAAVRVVELGKSRANVSPDCGPGTGRSCLTEGRVTGFQSLASGFERNRSFAAPYDGKLVSWSIRLSRPYAQDTYTRDGETFEVTDEVAAFDAIFGSPSMARISVLKQMGKKNKQPQYKLLRQGPVEVLNPYFGSTVQFALDEPLAVREGQVVALTIPTWAPAFWHPQACDFLPDTDEQVDPDRCAELTEANTWRGSRPSNRCSFEGAPGSEEQRESVERSRPQQKVGSVKPYGCYYGGSRLLYSATLVGQQ